MPLDDLQNPNQPVSNDQAPAAPATATPVTPASPSTPPATPAASPASGAQPVGNDQAMPSFPQNPNRSVRPNQETVSNAPAPVTGQPHADNPSVQRAGVIHSIAQALAGGP